MQHRSYQIPPSHAFFTFLEMAFTERALHQNSVSFTRFFVLWWVSCATYKILTYIQVFSPAIFCWITPRHFPRDRVLLAMQRKLQFSIYNLYSFLEVGRGSGFTPTQSYYVDHGNSCLFFFFPAAAAAATDDGGEENGRRVSIHNVGNHPP